MFTKYGMSHLYTYDVSKLPYPHAFTTQSENYSLVKWLGWLSSHTQTQNGPSKIVTILNFSKRPDFVDPSSHGVLIYKVVEMDNTKLGSVSSLSNFHHILVVLYISMNSWNYSHMKPMIYNRPNI